MAYSGGSALAIDSDAYALFEVPNETGTPERNLLLAILERAILDFVGNDQAELKSAECWIFSDEDEQELEFLANETESPAEHVLTPFSFAWVCHHLDLNGDDVRGRIREMPKRGARKIAPWYFKKAE